jgi:hypothetical protein
MEVKSRLAKKHVFGSEGMAAGKGCQILACALAVMVLHPTCLTANGPAIKGVSVPAIGGVARFLPSSCKFFEFYECRAAPRRNGVKAGVQGLWRPGHKSRYTEFYRSMCAVAV